jgi:hypothetical protein
VVERLVGERRSGVVAVAAFGAAGSGKTWTLFGGEDYDEQGLAPRAVAQVFELAAAAQCAAVGASLACAVARRDKVHDLLQSALASTAVDEWPTVTADAPLPSHAASSEEDALALLSLASVNRMVAAMGALGDDAASPRAEPLSAVLRVRFALRWKGAREDQELDLCFVDGAGLQGARLTALALAPGAAERLGVATASATAPSPPALLHVVSEFTAKASHRIAIACVSCDLARLRDAAATLEAARALRGELGAQNGRGLKGKEEDDGGDDDDEGAEIDVAAAPAARGGDEAKRLEAPLEANRALRAELARKANGAPAGPPVRSASAQSVKARRSKASKLVELFLQDDAEDAVLPVDGSDLELVHECFAQLKQSARRATELKALSVKLADENAELKARLAERARAREEAEERARELERKLQSVDPERERKAREADDDKFKQEWLARAAAGVAMLKFGRRGSPHQRTFVLRDGHLSWNDGRRSVAVAEIVAVVEGARSPLFADAKPAPRDDLCLALLLPDYSLCVQLPSADERRAWVRGLALLNPLLAVAKLR